MQFVDRASAGRWLAKNLSEYVDRPEVLVLGLPRGGVPVAYEVARALNAPLDVFLVRKLGVPGYEELAMGAIASGGIRVVDEVLVDNLGIPSEWIEKIATREQGELERREKLYRAYSEPLNLKDRIVIVVDDGLATGSTMRAAVKALKQFGPAQIIVATPVAARETCESFKKNGIATCVCVMSPERFGGVSRWYRDFSQTTDEEVCFLLKQAKQSLRRPVALTTG